MNITSTAFTENGMIPKKYTCDGENINPPLSFQNIPKNTQSLVITITDPDIPQEIKEKMGLHVFDHWIVYNIPPITEIKENAKNIGLPGLNSRGQPAYTGPCPPPQYEPKVHRYFFTIYALSTAHLPNFEIPPTRTQLESVMKGYILAKAEIMGKYTRI
ncbi:TPA: YbhB/YbcL family Raf kinase inhibitor-like protein [Candidatus Woesearchaeota archaeon]|nr:YbhB/YbcL family Raf kinase inhibitor-like protein [Candidatus Woesearchaeota archaeon]